MIKLSNGFSVSKREFNHFNFWTSVFGFESEYEISILGLRTVNRVIVHKNGGAHKKAGGLLKKPTKMSIGYFSYGLWKDNIEKRWTIHRLLAFHFIPQLYGDKTFVNHKDGNKENNSIQNLEWCTQRENNIHALLTGLRDPTTANHKKNGEHHSAKKVACYLNNAIVQQYACVKDAVEDRMVTVGYFLKNKKADPYGLHWKIIT